MDKKEKDYGLYLDEEEWEVLMNDIKNPKYNEKLAKAFRQRLVFEE